MTLKKVTINERIGPQTVQRYRSSLTLEPLMWPTLVIVDDLPYCRWSRFVKIFPTIPLVSLLEFWCVSEVFVILYFICSLSFLLIKPYVFQILQLERVANDIYDLWIVDIIYDSINNIIFLNILLNYIFFIIFFSFRMFETKKT